MESKHWIRQASCDVTGSPLSNSRLFNQITDIKAFQCYLISIINVITSALTFFFFYLNSNEATLEPP